MYVLYDTGDSFHREENVIELIGLYEYIEDALTVKESIKLDYERYKKSKHNYIAPIKVLLPKKNVIEEIGVYTWKGYFNRFRSVYFHCVSEVK